MGFSFKNKKIEQSTTAEVIDGYLILSVFNSTEPVVWRMSLEKIGTATFEIKEDAKNATAKLVLKPKKGTAEIIASFTSKEDALNALVSASNALQNGPSQKPAKRIKNADIQQPSNNNPETQKWLIALLGAFIVIGLYYYLTTLIPETTVGFNNQASTSINATSPQNTTGVPVSADDFLSGL